MNRSSFFALLSWLGTLAADTAADMPFFAMDTGTRDAAHRTADAQVAMVKELGFDGIGPAYTNPEALREMLAAVDRHDSKLFAIYLPLDLDAADPVSAPIRDAIGQLLAKLAELKWHGPVGLQHYGIKGDARANLQRSLDAWRKTNDKCYEASSEPIGIYHAQDAEPQVRPPRLDRATRPRSSFRMDPAALVHPVHQVIDVEIQLPHDLEECRIG
jgi:hypothetical protein